MGSKGPSFVGFFVRHSTHNPLGRRQMLLRRNAAGQQPLLQPPEIPNTYCPARRPPHTSLPGRTVFLDVRGDLVRAFASADSGGCARLRGSIKRRAC